MAPLTILNECIEEALKDCNSFKITHTMKLS